MSDPITETIVPIKVTQPADNAPPSLAEPASGPVAEMSGGVHPAEPSATESAPAESESWQTPKISGRN